MEDKMRIRQLAARTRLLAESAENQARRVLWSNLNSLTFTRPCVYVLTIPIQEVFPDSEFQCKDSPCRGLETLLLFNEYHNELQDDAVIEPFIRVNASIKRTSEGWFGLRAAMGEAQAGNAAGFSPTLIEESDIDRLRADDYEVDEDATSRTVERCEEALGGDLAVAVNRVGGLCREWESDIATALAKMRGLTQMMLDMYDRPEWLHAVVGRMQKMILKNIDQTEAAGGFNRASHINQVMEYANELPWPSADATPIAANQVWAHVASQEFTMIGPSAYKEFLFDYQKPIMERFGLVAYGCCEDLTQKIDLLKSVKNMRRIAVTQLADIRKCAEQLGGDYVLSWRPNPSPHVCFGVDEAFVRREIREALDIFSANGCKFDIMMKSCQTVSGDRNALIRWTRIVREEIDKRY